MMGQRLRFSRPGGQDELYPKRSKAGTIETLVNPETDSSLIADCDARSTFVYNRYHHLPMQDQRKKLPVFQYRNHVLYTLEKYQTLVLIGETGCGKSTQIPQYMQEIGHSVCVTQPRVAAAASLAARVADERGERLGEHVGFAAGMTAQRSTHTDIVFMTEGVLLREMFASPLLMQYSCIILDEVHERTQMTDILMGLLKKIAKKRKNLKIIISSATMDAESLRDFFNLSDKREERNSASVMAMQGRPHPIDVFYAREPVADYVKAAVATVIMIHERKPFGDILVFLTSQEEILTALETLRAYAEENNEKNKLRKTFPSGVQAANMTVLPMYGSLPYNAQIKVFQTADRNTRKVVLATNIAETSITIAGIVYVIDCGFHKLPYLDPAVGVETVCVAPISQRNAIQRAGRAGRTAPGECYRLYTEERYSKLPRCVPPEICRSDLSSAILQLKALGISNLLSFSFPTQPPAKSLLAGLETLYALKAINENGDLTDDIGKKMAELPLRPMCAAMVCNSGEYGCIEEALSIAAMLQVDSVFANTTTTKHFIAAQVARRNFEAAEGDIIMYLNIIESYIQIKSAAAADDDKRAKKVCKEWCQKHYLNYGILEKACEIRSSLEKLVKNKFQMENEVFEGTDLGSARCVRILKCVVSGYFPQAAYLHSNGSYRGVRGAQLHISPASCLYRMQQPKWVVFTAVQSAGAGDKVLMRELMVIPMQWLLEIAPHYYQQQ